MIECICYHETHDLFEPIIKQGQLYRIYNPEIKFANKKFTQVNNDYRLIMKESVSDIKVISQGNSVKTKDVNDKDYQYKFTKLS